LLSAADIMTATPTIACHAQRRARPNAIARFIIRHYYIIFTPARPMMRSLIRRIIRYYTAQSAML